MKAFILSIAFFSISNVSLAESIRTNSVFFSNPYSDEVAKQECAMAMHTLSVMSNRRVAFQASCEESFNQMNCNHVYCYQLNTKVVIVDEDDLLD
jgi:hypothetical protein